MRIDFATPDMSDVIGHDSQWYFERELLKHVEHEGKLDWLFAWYISSVFQGYAYNEPSVEIPKNRSYRVMGRITDMHHSIEKLVNWLNNIELDLLLFSYRSVARVLNHLSPSYHWEHFNGKKIFLPWSYEPSLYYPSDNHEYDVTFLGAVGRGPYPLRHEVNKEIRQICKKKGWKLFTRDRPSYLGKISSYVDSEKYVAGKNYAQALRLGRVTVFGSSIYRYPIKKWTQALGSGTCILANAPLNADRIGLKDGVNYIEIDESNWAKMLEWVLDDEDQRAMIAENGRKLALAKHTHEVRSKELLKILER